MVLSAPKGAFPTGAVVGLTGAGAAILVATLHLDRLPLVLCMFRRVTGLPCATCGSTRALARLVSGDIVSAFRVNPLAVLVLVGMGAWALMDLALLLRGRALVLRLSDREARFLVGAGFAALAVNWAYLLMNLR